MRLLCLTNLFPDTAQPWRGLDNVTLLHAMRAERPDTDIRVLCLRPGHGFWTGASCDDSPRAGDEVLNPSYHWVPYIPKLGGLNDRFYAMGVHRALKSLPQGWQPDALLVPWLFPDACAVHRIPELAHLPLLAVAQGSDVHQYLDMPFRKKAILDLCQRAHVITRSEDLRQHLVRAGAPADHVSTVYNGVDIQTFRPAPKLAARQELGLPKAPKTLVFVGNFLPVKGIDLLIDAASEVNREYPLHLVLIGSGPLEQDIRNRCQKGGLTAEQVTFPGRLGPDKVARYMQAADTICLSSLNEGVPNVLLEAFASGRPLVSTDVGGISEVTGPSPGGGFLTEGRGVDAYASALRATFVTPPNENDLSQYAAAFSWPRCADSYFQRLFALSEERQ